jgi:ParB family chromosome partitioning protein
MENIVRDDLNPVDRSAALRMLKEQLGDPPWEAVAEAVGIKRSRLFQLLSTEKLPDAIQDDIRSGRLSEKQSRALQNLDPGFQRALGNALISGQISTERATALARELRSLPAPSDDGAANAIVHSLIERSDAAGQVPVETPPHVPARELLALLTRAARGNSEAAAHLARGLAGAAPARYSPDRLEKSLQAQVGLLAALHTAPPRERAQARDQLEALRDALNALLDAR